MLFKALDSLLLLRLQIYRTSRLESLTRISIIISKNLTQEKMAEKLAISPRAYIDLEYGKYACSMITCLLFLVRLKDEAVLQLLRECRNLVDDADQDAA